jgi:hypothetical protein
MVVIERVDRYSGIQYWAAAVHAAPFEAPSASKENPGDPWIAGVLTWLRG